MFFHPEGESGDITAYFFFFTKQQEHKLEKTVLFLCSTVWAWKSCVKYCPLTVSNWKYSCPNSNTLITHICKLTVSICRSVRTVFLMGIWKEQINFFKKQREGFSSSKWRRIFSESALHNCLKLSQWMSLG